MTIHFFVLMKQVSRVSDVNHGIYNDPLKCSQKTGNNIYSNCLLSVQPTTVRFN